MATIPTLRGEVETSALGFTLMHEHLFLHSPTLYANYPQLFDRAAAFCEQARAAGVDTIVDLTTIDLGRDTQLMADVAARTELHVVAATGVHLNVPNNFRRKTPDRVVELYVQDLTEGIAGSGIRAGATIAALCTRGYADRMVLSHDTAPRLQGVPREVLDRALPEANFVTVSKIVLPALQERGVDEEQIEAMTVGNPRRIFEAQGAY